MTATDVRPGRMLREVRAARRANRETADLLAAMYLFGVRIGFRDDHYRMVHDVRSAVPYRVAARLIGAADVVTADPAEAVRLVVRRFLSLSAAERMRFLSGPGGCR